MFLRTKPNQNLMKKAGNDYWVQCSQRILWMDEKKTKTDCLAACFIYEKVRKLNLILSNLIPFVYETVRMNFLMGGSVWGNCG